MATPTEPTPPSKEELMARLQDLHGRAVELRDRANAQAKAQQGGLKWGRILFLFGAPLAAGIGVGKATGSTLYGALAGIAVMVVVIIVLSKLSPTPASLKPGTRAWEAKMTAGLLENIIAQRRSEQAAAAGNQRDKLGREIAFLEEQLAENNRVWAAEDASPGKGYVGFKPYEGK
jgi:hypothetical protein